MKRLTRLAGRLLCWLDFHRWSDFGFSLIRTPFGSVLCRLTQCERCGVGMTISPIIGNRMVDVETMQEAQTRAEIDEIASEIASRE